MNEKLENLLTTIVVKFPLLGAFLLTLDIVEDDEVSICIVDKGTVYVNFKNLFELKSNQQRYILLNAAHSVALSVLELPIEPLYIPTGYEYDAAKTVIDETVEKNAPEDPALKDKLVSVYRTFSDRGFPSFNGATLEKIHEIDEQYENVFNGFDEDKANDILNLCLQGENLSKVSGFDVFRFSVAYGGRVNGADILNKEEILKVVEALPVPYMITFWRSLNPGKAIKLSGDKMFEPAIKRVMQTINEEAPA